MLLWVLIWVVLLLGAGLVLGLLGLSLWRKARALTRDVGATAERLTAVLASLNDLADQSGRRADSNTVWLAEGADRPPSPR